MSYIKRKTNNSYVDMEDVEVLRESAKAYLCRWQDVEQWVPKSMMHPDLLQPGSAPAVGDVFCLSVREFIQERWFEEKPAEETISFDRARIARETDRGLQVELESGWIGWLPKWAVPETSPTRFSTDPRGRIDVIARIARDKGMCGAAPTAPVGNAARQYDPSGGEDGGFPYDYNDDIPF